MSHVSPHSRSESERSQNQNATAVFLAVAGAILFGALWLANSSMITTLKREWEKNKGSETNEVTVPENRDSDSASRVDWGAQIAAIEKQLPGPNTGQQSNHLKPVLRLLEKGDLSEQEQAMVRHLLDQLARHVAMLNRPPSQSLNSLGTLDGRLDSLAQSIRTDDDTVLRTAVEKAEQRVRAEHANRDPSERELRLGTNDNQDKVAALRREIVQTQQEQREFQAKAARLSAMQRDMADIKRYLQPFTAPGYLQPKSDRNAWDTERTVDAKPVSLSRLKRLGALEDTMEGLERLYIFGGGKNPVLNNSRPLGSFPQYWAQHLSKPEVSRAVKRAQQLLREHGQALVEEQRLSP